MKKLIAILFTIVAAYAVGPRIHHRVLTWTPSPSQGVTGYWIYWRAPGDIFSDSRRIAISTNTSSLDAQNLMLSEGIWDFAMTATNKLGDESNFSNIVRWNSKLPLPPSITVITTTP